MGSSSRKGASAGAATGAPTQMTPKTGPLALPGGKQVPFYANQSVLPAGGGLVRPPTGPGGPEQGAGLNFMQPQAAGAGAGQRQSLAQMMYSDMMRRTGGGGNMRSGGGGSPGSYTTSGRGWRGGPSSAGSGGLY